MTGGSEPVVGVILAGGRARRMGGGDKGLRTIGGRPMLDHVVERARPQVSRLILNAGGDAARFKSYGLPVVADVIDGFAGPLAGILTGLRWAAENVPGARWVASFASDAPFLPTGLVAGLMAAAENEGADMATAASGGRAHPVFALWPVASGPDLQRAMTEDGVRKIDLWTAALSNAQVDFPCQPLDPFFNINRPEDLAAAERLYDLTKEGAA